MRIKVYHKIPFLIYIMAVLAVAVPAFALHPDSKIPDKVCASDQSCKTLIDTAAKYKIEGVFSKEFEEGKECFTRIDLAASLHLIVERLAEKVVKEGSESVARADLNKLNEIEEDLRSEMLLVHTRSFQSKDEGLGTNLHPLTRNISLSGGMVGFFQNSINNKQASDSGSAVGRSDLVFNFKISDSTIAVIDIRAVGGSGIDSRIANFAGLNAGATDDGDNVRFRKAFIEHSIFDDRLIASAGKISITDYFDTNTVANDENSQFLAGAFVNAHAMLFPADGPGVRIHAKLGESLTLGLGYASGNASGDNITNNGFGIAELDFRLKATDREGNYRFYAAIDGSHPDYDPASYTGIKTIKKNAYNAGVSFDQQITDKLTLFARYSQREQNAYVTSRAWSGGLQYAGLIPGRDNDVLGLAYGQIAGKGTYLPAQEKLFESYYSIKLHEKVKVSPVFQLLVNPLGNQTGNYGSVSVMGLRAQATF